jgi:adenosine deaminase
LIAMEQAGLNWSVQADNRLISVLTQGSEFQVAHEVCGLTMAQIMRGQIRAARASFLPAFDRLQAEAKLKAWCAAGSIAIDL